jgi:anti-anti-sigma regulatory factor
MHEIFFFLKNESKVKSIENELNAKIDEILSTVHIKDVIIDFSCVNIIDSMGINAIAQVTN